MPILGIHHIQVSMPKGKETEARSFYGKLLGLEELPKPPILAARGGVWFQCGNHELHLGIEEPFIPARKAHPAFIVTAFEPLVTKLRAEDIEVVEDNSIPDMRRAFITDPFGNRIELISV